MAKSTHLLISIFSAIVLKANGILCYKLSFDIVDTMYIQTLIKNIQYVYNMKTVVNIRVDEEVKEQAEIILEDLGLNLSSGINLFLKALVRHKGIPFSLVSDIKDVKVISERKTEEISDSSFEEETISLEEAFKKI